MASENVVSIYKIDYENPFFEGCSSLSDAVTRIITRGNEKIQSKVRNNRGRGIEVDSYALTQIRDVESQGFEISLFHSRRSVPNSWNDFLASVLQENQGLYNQNHDFIVFVSDDVNLFCFTGGIAGNLVEDICDESFPKDLMIRLSDPEKIKQAKSRGLTGAFYARDLYFRGDYSISPTEAFGSIWKDVRASIREEIWDDEDWQAILGDRTSKDISCDVKSSFKLRKRVSFEDAIGLIGKFKEVMDIPPSESEAAGFYFLNTIKLVRNKEEKQKLNDLLAQRAYTWLTDAANSPAFDFDFCHKDYGNFYEANRYVAKHGNSELHEWDRIPEASQVLLDLRAEFDLSTFDSFNRDFTGGIKIAAECADDELKTTRGTILDHLNGEMEVVEDEVSRTYFLVDKNWCLVNDDFINVLSQEFSTYINALNLDEVSLKPWSIGDEGEYNESFIGERGFVVGDRITLNGIELFDLLYLDNDNLYIIQVKDGLGSCTRDACSQLRNSARIIEESLKGADHKKLREFYQRLHNTSIAYAQRPDYQSQLAALGTAEDFIDLLQAKQRTYLLAFRYGEDKQSVIDTRSNIAKFEILGLKDGMKSFDVKFRLCQILSF